MKATRSATYRRSSLLFGKVLTWKGRDPMYSDEHVFSTVPGFQWRVVRVKRIERQPWFHPVGCRYSCRDFHLRFLVNYLIISPELFDFYPLNEICWADWTDKWNRKKITIRTLYHTKGIPRDHIQHSLWNKNISLSYMLFQSWNKYSLSIFVGLRGRRWKSNENKIKNALTCLGTATSIPTMCFVDEAWTIWARITWTVMLAWSVSGKNGKMNALVRYDRWRSELTERKH